MRKLGNQTQVALKEKDQAAASETMEYLAQSEPPVDLAAIPPIEPIDQSQRPPVPIGGPLPIVDIEEAIQPTHSRKEPGVDFFCGELGMLHFEDKTKYHVKNRHFTIHDPELIAKLMEATKNPSNKLFVQQQ